MTMCIIFTQADYNFVATVPDGAAPDDARRTGELYEADGPSKGYTDGYSLNPIRRANDAQGNARFIVNAAVMTRASDSDPNVLMYGTAVPYMSGLPQIDSNDPNFPGVYTPPGG
jgi:hypothetical protein